MRFRGAARMLAVVALCAAPPAAAAPGPDLAVDAAASRHAISPFIYGWNFADPGFAAEIQLPVDRRGGNKADTLNWQTGVESTSNDYYFENLPWCWDDAYGYCSPEPPASDAHRAYTDQIDANRAVGARTLIDVPMLGYVPKAPAKYAHPFDCSFTDALFPAQNSFDPFQPDMNKKCGDGRQPHPNENQWVTNTPQLATATADSPATEAAWVDDLEARYGSAADGGVLFYELGNEPALWNDTHHDWHPAPTTYDELWSKSQALAQAIKGADPTAQILGFSEWGWPHYFCSAADDISNGCSAADTDRAAHGGTPIVEWLLQQFKQWADDHGGQRLIDYLDLHYYRQDDGASGIAPTRSLWDPTYTDPSWISDTIKLIPRMRKWVDDHFPGTKISLSEYDLSIDGADGDNVDSHRDVDNLIQADTLGIFGREGLDLATLWPLVDASHYKDAFRLFRNYDGSHSKFGDTSVSAQSANQGQLAVYGAVRSADDVLTLVVINKTAGELTSTLSLSNFSPAGPAKVFRFTSADSGIQAVADQAVTDSGFSASFPALSMTMIAIPGPPSAEPASPPPTTTPAGSPSTTTPPSTSPPVTQPTVNPTTAKSRCVVPRLKGLTLAKAKAKLKKAHCRLGKVTRKKSRIRRGRVIRQTVAAKKKLKPGARVGVVLSRGR